MGVGEFDVDVLLVDTGQFALELVRFFVLADVEFGVEGSDGGGGAAAALGVVVEETEEGSNVVVWEAWEERHGVYGFGEEVGCVSWNVVRLDVLVLDWSLSEVYLRLNDC